MKLIGKFAILLILIPAAILAAPAVGSPERGMNIGDILPAKNLKTLDMEKVPVPSEEGLTVLLFWATWSPRSISALQLWQELKEDYSEHNIKILAVNAEGQHLESAERQKVRNYIEENDIKLQVHMDSDLDLFNEIGVIVLPTTLFLHNDGEIVYKYTSFPSSARIDLKEGLEKELGIFKEASPEISAHRGKLEYQPKNRALLYYNLGSNLHKKGFTEKARARYIIALQKDPEYKDPLRALEGLYFVDGQTPESEEELKALLIENNLEPVVEHIGEGEAVIVKKKEKKVDPMARMRALMGQSAPAPAATTVEEDSVLPQPSGDAVAGTVEIGNQ